MAAQTISYTDPSMVLFRESCEALVVPGIADTNGLL